MYSSIESNIDLSDPWKIKIGKRYFERNLSGKFHELLFHYRDEFYEAIIPNDLVDLTFDDNDSKFIYFNSCLVFWTWNSKGMFSGLLAT